MARLYLCMTPTFHVPQQTNQLAIIFLLAIVCEQRDASVGMSSTHGSSALWFPTRNEKRQGRIQLTTCPLLRTSASSMMEQEVILASLPHDLLCVD